jgi:hypothetical protein
MKSKLVIAGLIIIAAVMLPSLSSVMATVQSPPLTVSRQDYVWTVDLLHPFVSGYSGKDAITVEAKYYIMVDNPTPPYDPPKIPEYHTLIPVKVSFTDSQIKLWFDPAQFPDTATENFVTVTFTDGKALTFNGPGWTHGNVG